MTRQPLGQTARSIIAVSVLAFAAVIFGLLAFYAVTQFFAFLDRIGA